jgi:RNA-directed DNA polymerase
VWTERMLAALENGVKGGKWFSLIDKVCSPKNLKASWAKVQKNKGAAGTDQQSVAKFQACEELYLKELRQAIKTDMYQPQPALRRWIPKPGTQKKRPLGIPTVKDRIVQGALRHVLEPLWEAKFADNSFGFRPGRSQKDALRRVDSLLKAGRTWVVDADIQSYFDNIEHDRLMSEIQTVVADGRVLALVERFLKQSIMEGMKTWQPEKGTPQGAVVSPLLSNIYLHPVDLAVQSAGFEMVRYADDLIILCGSKQEAQRALALLQQEMRALGLTLHPEKTRLVDAREPGGFDFLGYHFERGLRWPREKSMKSLKDKIRQQTRRTQGRSLMQVISELNPILRGWFGYFKHSHWTTFEVLDKWTRMRLRSILRKFNKRKGRGRGLDHRRWPNAYFAEAGLFTQMDAWHDACRSR